MLRTELVRTFLLAMALSAPAGVVSAPAAMAADPVVTPAGVSSDEVSFDGRYLWDADTFQVVDRLTGTRSAVPACSGDRCWAAGFVRDNPSLVLQFEYGPRPIAGEAGDRPSNRPPLTGVYLVDTVSGA
ncbi:MAG TPA: hypothetical protein VF143_04010, partial [Candidatus Nanopelagicales bacterium]